MTHLASTNWEQAQPDRLEGKLLDELTLKT